MPVKKVLDKLQNIVYNICRFGRFRHAVPASKPVQEAKMLVSSVQPHQIPTPYEIGFEDAQNGEPFLPEAYYVNHRQMRKYAEGFNAARPNPYAAAYLGHKNFVPAEV